MRGLCQSTPFLGSKRRSSGIWRPDDLAIRIPWCARKVAFFLIRRYNFRAGFPAPEVRPAWNSGRY
jgi:hypothetical protein